VNAGVTDAAGTVADLLSFITIVIPPQSTRIPVA
jgi:hypothetical protein